MINCLDRLIGNALDCFGRRMASFEDRKRRWTLKMTWLFWLGICVVGTFGFCFGWEGGRRTSWCGGGDGDGCCCRDACLLTRRWWQEASSECAAPWAWTVMDLHGLRSFIYRAFMDLDGLMPCPLDCMNNYWLIGTLVEADSVHLSIYWDTCMVIDWYYNLLHEHVWMACFNHTLRRHQHRATTQWTSILVDTCSSPWREIFLRQVLREMRICWAADHCG